MDDASGAALKINVKGLVPIHTPDTSGPRPYLERLSDDELLESVYWPHDGRMIRIHATSGRLMDGNGRAFELQRRAADPNSSIVPDTEVPYEVYAPRPTDGGRQNP